LWLWSRSRFGLGGRPGLGLGSWPVHGLGTRLRHGLWGWAVLGLRRRLRLRRGTVLVLRRMVLRLFGAILRLLRLLVAVLWLFGAVLRLLRLVGTGLRPLLRLVGAWLLGRNGARVRLAGTDLGLTRAYFQLAGPDRLNLGPVVWFSWAIALLAGAIALFSGTDLGLAGAVGHGSRICSRIRSLVGAGEAGLRGDRPRGCDHGWAASVDVVELLAVL
jgi:hypothetical protein